jgi:hypothetical protein
MARRLITILVAATVGGLVLVGAGCGGGGSSSTSSETTTETTTPLTQTTETTETTEATTEATETTETTETSASSGATAKDCQEFAQIGSKISSALTGSTDVQKVKDAFDQLTAAAPDDIKGDFQTLSKYIGQIADALHGVEPGQTPSAAALAKLQSIDSAEATKASQNIATWVQQNCTG